MDEHEDELESEDSSENELPHKELEDLSSKYIKLEKEL